MPSFVVTGANRGIGFAFLSYIANRSPSDTVIGIVRNVEELTSKISENKNLANNKNIHIIQADVTDRASLEQARDKVSEITRGSLDCLINNAAYLPGQSALMTMADYTPPDKVADLESELRKSLKVNTIGVVNTSLIFVPLLRNGTLKKVLTLSTGVADFDVVADLELCEGVSYAVSKAALNMAVLKFHNVFQKEGLLFFGISPGVVNTGNMEKMAKSEMPEKFAKYQPDFKGPMAPDESVKMVMDVLDKATIKETGGKMVSHFGNKQWL